jgi:hypothetical protein
VVRFAGGAALGRPACGGARRNSKPLRPLAARRSAADPGGIRLEAPEGVHAAFAGGLRLLLGADGKDNKNKDDSDPWRALPVPRQVQTTSPRSGSPFPAAYGYASSLPATKMNGPIVDGWMANAGAGAPRAAAYGSSYGSSFGGSYSSSAGSLRGR